MSHPPHDGPWQPDSWRRFPSSQQPTYPDLDHLARIEAQLRQRPATITPPDAAALQDNLARAATGDTFILQAGDCAEPFADAVPVISQRKYNALMMLATWLELLIHQPVVTIGRIAGQFSKPRSQPYERQPHAELPAFRGDLVHSSAPSLASRTPDPDRLLLGSYLSEAIARDLWAASATASRTTSLTELMHCVQASRYHELHAALTTRYREPIELATTASPLYYSHEALLLPYEQALTHRWHHQYYNQGAHFLWLGYRTRQIGAAHLEYLRGLANPLGIKLGADTTTSELRQYLHILSPDHRTLVLILRMGQAQICAKLRELIPVVLDYAAPVVWMMDPMHGQYALTPSQQKTRYIDVMVTELSQAIHTLGEFGQHLGGLHLETTHEAVEECIDHSSTAPTTSPLSPYTSQCDPRLNTSQALWLMWQVFGDQQLAAK